MHKMQKITSQEKYGQPSQQQKMHGLHPSILDEYKEKNRRVFKQRPVKNSKYTNITQLEALLVTKQGTGIKIVPKAGYARIMTIKQAMSEMPEKIGRILSKEEKAKDQFEAFINANFDEKQECVVIISKECTYLELDIELPQGACTKYFIIVGKNSDVSILEKVNPKGNALIAETIYLEGNQTVSLAKINLGKNSVVSCQQNILEKDAKLVNNNSWFGGELVRASTSNILDGKGSIAEDYSLLLGDGKENYDINYRSIHRAQDSFSHSIFNSVLKGESRTVYDGMIRVEETGARTNALLETHSMILGEKASSNQVPQLEIQTDDVKATHSATVAHIEEDELFYMQARGISREETKRMVVKSFLESIVLKLPERLRRPIVQEIDRKL